MPFQKGNQLAKGSKGGGRKGMGDGVHTEPFCVWQCVCGRYIDFRTKEHPRKTKIESKLKVGKQ